VTEAWEWAYFMMFRFYNWQQPEIPLLTLKIGLAAVTQIIDFM
jgi:hypothetical protein